MQSKKIASRVKKKRKHYEEVEDSINFKYNMKNVDGIGYEPDIWCNPKDALEAVRNLIKNEGYASVDSTSELKKQIEVATTKTITLG